LEGELPGYDVKKLDARMVMLVHVPRIDVLEFCVIGVKFPVLRSEIQALEIVGRITSLRGLRKTQAILFSDNLQHRFGLRFEEVFQPHAEDKRYAQVC
jgi:hypothetical protein